MRCCAVVAGTVAIVIGMMASPVLATAPQFFGIQIYEASDIDDAFSVKAGEDGSVTYTYRESMVDTSIFAWGTLEEDCLTLDLVNESETTLYMLFESDQYGYYTLDDDIFMLELMMTAGTYPTSIEPGESETVVLYRPPAEHLDQINFFAVRINYRQTAIALKRIQTE